MTPGELKQMVESTPGSTVQMKTVNGIVLKPKNPFAKPACTSLAEWALSATDIDVNYIAHVVKI